MNRIDIFYNQSSSYFMHTLTPVNPIIKRIAIVAFVLIGVVTLGIAIDALCRKLHPMDENDEADDIMENLFNETFREKEEINEEVIIPKERPQNTPKKIVKDEEDLSSSDESDNEISPNNDFKIDSGGEVTSEQLLDIQKELKQYFNTKNQKFTFASKGILYFAWYDHAHPTINIHTVKDFTLDLMNTSNSYKNVLGIMLKNDGKIVAIINSGNFVEVDLVPSISKDLQKNLLAHLYSQLNSKATPSPKPVTPPVKSP